MKLTIGGHSTNALLDRLNASGICMNSYAAEYIDDLRCHVTIISRTLDIRFVSPEELSLNSGAPLSRIYAAALQAGLDFCPPDAALYLRLAMTDQPVSADSILSAGRCPDGAVTVAASPVTNSSVHRGLYLRNVDGQLWLRGYVCDDEYIWPKESIFAFAATVSK